MKETSATILPKINTTPNIVKELKAAPSYPTEETQPPAKERSYNQPKKNNNLWDHPFIIKLAFIVVTTNIMLTFAFSPTPQIQNISLNNATTKPPENITPPIVNEQINESSLLFNAPSTIERKRILSIIKRQKEHVLPN